MQFWKNYKTTAIGFGLAVLIAVQPFLSPGGLQLTVAVLVGALGFFAKDANAE